MQRWTLLNEQIDGSKELQKEQRERLAGIVHRGSIVAVRHSDSSVSKHLYYLGRVSKVSLALACSSSSLRSRVDSLYSFPFPGKEQLPTDLQLIRLSQQGQTGLASAPTPTDH